VTPVPPGPPDPALLRQAAEHLERLQALLEVTWTGTDPSAGLDDPSSRPDPR